MSQEAVGAGLGPSRLGNKGHTHTNTDQHGTSLLALRGFLAGSCLLPGPVGARKGVERVTPLHSSGSSNLPRATDQVSMRLEAKAESARLLGMGATEHKACWPGCGGAGINSPVTGVRVGSRLCWLAQGPGLGGTMSSSGD